MANLIRIATSSGKIYLEPNGDFPIMSHNSKRSMDDVGFKAFTGEVIDLAKDSFDKSLTALKEIAGSIIDKVKELGPDNVEVEFGFKVGGEGDIYIAKCSTEGHFTVKLSWDKKNPKMMEDDQQ